MKRIWEFLGKSLSEKIEFIKKNWVGWWTSQCFNIYSINWIFASINLMCLWMSKVLFVVMVLYVENTLSTCCNLLQNFMMKWSRFLSIHSQTVIFVIHLSSKRDCQQTFSETVCSHWFKNVICIFLIGWNILNFVWMYIFTGNIAQLLQSNFWVLKGNFSWLFPFPIVTRVLIMTDIWQTFWRV